MNVIAGSWLIASVNIERTTQMSSAIDAMLGMSSLKRALRLAVLLELER